MTAELPRGTVTLVFTDIEGSTQLLQDLGSDAYVLALEQHRRLLRDTVAAHGGVEVEMQGDSFHFAFASARAAATAAAAAQRALTEHPWEVRALRVRMGLHTGEPVESGGLYAGLDVHRAARVMSAAHGGQVLVSDTSADLVQDELPAGVSLRDLGVHRLKDLSLPRRLYDLVIEGLPSQFPAPRTLENRPTNLPVVPTPLVGREQEVRELRELVRRDGVRLVTVTGPGGTGKTRLALHVAGDLVDSYDDGVFFVALAPIRDHALVTSVIAQTLGVREQPGESLVETLREHLLNRRTLLLLDNFEHVLDAATDVADLLSSSRQLQVLVTSRAGLSLSGEHHFAVPPLAVPAPESVAGVDAISQYEGVRLFIERARAVRSDFTVTNANAPAVAEICVRLDGLPLAIELAAARIGVLTPEALLKRLDQRLAFLTGGARDRDERQQTLRAAIEWSYDLLTEPEKELFAQLSVFAGGARLETAESVLADPSVGADALLDRVESLVAKSLLRRTEDPDAEPRLYMLETIREYAFQRLRVDGHDAVVRRRHAEHFAAVAEEAEHALKGPRRLEWLQRLDLDQDNIRAALEFGLDADNELALRLAGSLWRFWEDRARATEGLRWARAALRRNGGFPQSRARALVTAARMEWVVGDVGDSDRLLAEALVLFEELGDAPRHTFALIDRSWDLRELGDNHAARSHAREGLARARELGDRWAEAYALLTLGSVTASGTADDLLAESERIFLEVGDEGQARVCRGNRAWLALGDGRYDEAVRISLEVGEDAHRFGDMYIWANSLNNAAQGELLSERRSEAEAHLRESLGLLERFPSKRLTAEAIRSVAALAALDGDAGRSGRLFGAACGILERSGTQASRIEERIEAELIRPLRERRQQAFARAFDEGRAMEPAEAIRYALRHDAHLG